MTNRVVALIDMDCFYCQVETRMRPELLGTPVAVVQYKTWKGGGIIAVNYEARAEGVTRFMRGNEAKAQCPSITLCSVPEVRGKADLSRYRNAGREVIAVFSQFSRCVERASIDEAFIDLTDVVEKRMDKLVLPEQLPNTFVVGFSPQESNDHADGMKGVKEWLFSIYDSELDDLDTKKLAVGAAIVEEIRAAVYEKTGFRCSAGIAHNKIIAKLAAGLHKPNRQTVLPQSGVPILYKSLPVKKVRNLGRKLGDAVMEQLGCKVMADLSIFSLKDLQHRFDEKTGTWLYNISRGIDHEPVSARLLPKSIGCSKRFPGNSALGTVDEVFHWLSELSSEVSERLKDDLILNNRCGKVLTVMGAYTVEGKYNSFSRSGPINSYDEKKIAECSMNLIKKSNTASSISGAWSPPLINLGVSVAKFIDTIPGLNNIKQFFSMPSTNSRLNEEKVDCESKNEDKTEENEAVNPNISENLPAKKESKSFLERFFKRNQNKTSDDPSSAVASVNELTDASNDGLESNEEENFCDENVDTDISDMKVCIEEPSTSFFEPKHNSTNLESSINRDSISEVKDNCTLNLPNDTDSSDCWKIINEIFPDLDNIDLDVVQLLPKNLRDVFYESNFFKRTLENSCKSPNITKTQVKSLTGLNKSTKNKSSKSVGVSKESGQKYSLDTTLSQYFSKRKVKETDESTFTKKKRKSNDCIEDETPVFNQDEKITEHSSEDEQTDMKENEDVENLNFIGSCDIFDDVGDEKSSANNGKETEIIFEESMIDFDASGIPPKSSLPLSKNNDQQTVEVNDQDFDVSNLDKTNKSSDNVKGRDSDLKCRIFAEQDAQMNDVNTPGISSPKIDLNTKKCEICHEEIIVASMPEHLDYHAALSLHKELNSSQNSPSFNQKNTVNNSLKPKKNKTNMDVSNNSSLKKKKKLSGKNSEVKKSSFNDSKKSMDIKSFFSAR